MTFTLCSAVDMMMRPFRPRAQISFKSFKATHKKDAPTDVFSSTHEQKYFLS